MMNYERVEEVASLPCGDVGLFTQKGKAEKGSYRLLAFACGLFAAITFPLCAAFSEVITIKGAPEFKSSSSNSQIVIEGQTKFTNLGDETAFEAFPEYSIGGWKWVGEPKDIVANQEVPFTFRKSFSPELLSCRVDKKCAGADLPNQGSFPVLIQRRYQDGNGYRFSAAGVKNIIIGEIDENAAGWLRSPEVTARLELSGPGAEFTGILTVLNGTTESLDVVVNFFTSRELQILSAPSLITIDSASEKRVSLKLKNFAGLLGSSYAVYAVLQWEQRGVRNTNWVGGVVSVDQQASGNFFFIAVGIVVVLFTILAYFLIFHHRPKGQDQ